MKAPGQKMATEQATKAAAPVRAFGIPKPPFAGLRKNRVAQHDQGIYSRELKWSTTLAAISSEEELTMKPTDY